MLVAVGFWCSHCQQGLCFLLCPIIYWRWLDMDLQNMADTFLLGNSRIRYCSIAVNCPVSRLHRLRAMSSTKTSSLQTPATYLYLGFIARPLMLWSLSTFGGSHYHLSFNNSLELPTELKRVLYIQFYLKGCESCTVKWRDAYNEVCQGPNAKHPCSQDLSSSQHNNMYHQPGLLTKFRCLRLRAFGGVY